MDDSIPFPENLSPLLGIMEEGHEVHLGENKYFFGGGRLYHEKPKVNKVTTPPEPDSQTPIDGSVPVPPYMGTFMEGMKYEHNGHKYTAKNQRLYPRN
jgi:hypothetical protein